jgi:probable rRNA maturation factor
MHSSSGRQYMRDRAVLGSRPVSDPVVEIVNLQRRHPVDRDRIRRVAGAAFRGGKGEGEVITILLAGDRKLRQLNRDYRGKDSVTDILSFPSGELTSEGKVHVGDIALSMEEAVRQADEEGCECEQVVDRLVTHGVLHLLGFDHEVDDGEMMALQAEVLAGLARGEAR